MYSAVDATTGSIAKVLSLQCENKVKCGICTSALSTNLHGAARQERLHGLRDLERIDGELLFCLCIPVLSGRRGIVVRGASRNAVCAIRGRREQDDAIADDRLEELPKLGKV